LDIDGERTNGHPLRASSKTGLIFVTPKKPTNRRLYFVYLFPTHTCDVIHQRADKAELRLTTGNPDRMKKINKMKSSKLGSSGSSAISGPPVSSTLVNGKAKGMGTGSSTSNGTSSSSSSSSAQDESNMKLIRDLCHIECNRYCFECGQRGPTYVDVTIGSFVCMTCSGLL